MSIQLKQTVFESDNVSIVVTDKSPVTKTTTDRLQELDLFSNVFYVESKKICERKNSLIGKIDDVWKIINGANINCNQEMRIDLLLYYNLDLTTLIIFANVYPKNKSIKCARYEEGVLSYNNAFYICEKFKLGDYIRKVFGKKTLVESTENFYCCYPSAYNGNLSSVQVPKIDTSGHIGSIMKQIFALNINPQDYKYKYIYFSSVYDFEGGEPIGEIDLMRRIRNHVGNDNLLVKVHPRDTRSVFADENFNIDKNSKIPWEAIQLNLDCSDKVFITANSGSVLSINMMLEPMPRTVFGYKCCNIDGNKFAKTTVNNIEMILDDKALQQNLGNVHIISSVNEL